MDAGMITEWREKKRMKEEEMSEKQSLNAGGIDVQMKGGGNVRKKEQKREKNGVIANNNREKIKLSASQQKI